MFLMIDNYDSFVYNLVRYLEELSVEVLVVRNDQISLEGIEAMEDLEGIIISPGPKRPEDAGMSERVVKAFEGRLPILGICLGHQVIGHVYGATVTKGERPVHGKVHAIDHNGDGLFKEVACPFMGTRYHSLVVEEKGLPDCLRVTARSQDGAIMGLEHKDLPIYGLQFHPEAALSDYGHQLLENFIRKCREDFGITS